jgi:hypothetical protein
MKKTMLALLCAAAALSAVTSAQAAGGCGPYAHRGPWGGCRPYGYGYARPGVYVGVPAVGVFYGGRGWWDGRRYWANRYRWGGGWRYR